MLITESQVNDLMGMQACNTQNLPENYTMRYCASISRLFTPIIKCS